MAHSKFLGRLLCLIKVRLKSNQPVSSTPFDQPLHQEADAGNEVYHLSPTILLLMFTDPSGLSKAGKRSIW